LTLGILGFLSILRALSEVATGPDAGGIGALIRVLWKLVCGTPEKLPTLLQAFSLIVAVNLMVVMAGALVVTSLQLRARHRAQRQGIDLVARQDFRWPEVSFVDLPLPLAYFIPGAEGRIVVAEQLVARAPETHIEVIVAHELAHSLAPRSGHVVLRLMVPFVAILPYARLTESVISRTFEFAADDIAARTCGRANVIETLETVRDLGHNLDQTPRALGELNRRIARLKEPPPSKWWTSARLLGWTVAALMATLAW
jgi:Zn-dependent protease with chaperone function